jgi:protein TonB
VVRGKQPEADLKRTYGKRFGLCLLASAVGLGIVAFLFPRFEQRIVVSRMIDPVIIIIDDIPETAQEPLPALPPDIPAAGEGLAVKDAAADTDRVDIDFLASQDLSVGMPRDMELDEETVGFWTVSREPVLIKEVLPDYPAEARAAGLEGAVFVKFAVGSNGRVKKALVLKGPEIFREPALRAVYQFEFIPAMQNEKPVAVWMTLPIRFQLLDRYEPKIRRR